MLEDDNDGTIKCEVCEMVIESESDLFNYDEQDMCETYYDNARLEDEMDNIELELDEMDEWYE